MRQITTTISSISNKGGAPMMMPAPAAPPPTPTMDTSAEVARQQKLADISNSRTKGYGATDLTGNKGTDIANEKTSTPAAKEAPKTLLGA